MATPNDHDGASGAIRITLRCFSHVRDVLGTSDLVLELARGATAAELIANILARAGGKLDGLPVRVAVNQEFVDAGHVLADGDEVALIPPVQGG